MLILRKTETGGIQMERAGNPIRNEIKTRDTILKKIDALAKKTGSGGEFGKARPIVEKIFDRDTTAHYKAKFENGLYIFDSMTLIEHRELAAEITEIVEDVRKFLHSEGYRPGYLTLTPQEHKLTGDVPNPKWKPFMPVGLHVGEFTLGEADKARRLSSYVYSCLAHLHYELGALFAGAAQGLAEYVGRFGYDVGGLLPMLQDSAKEKFSLHIGNSDYEARKTDGGMFELHYTGMEYTFTLEPLHKIGQEAGNTLRTPRIVQPLLTDEKLDEIFGQNEFEKALDLCTIETKKAEPLYWELRK